MTASELYPHTISPGTLAGLDPDDQAVIRDRRRKGYWKLVDSHEKTKINP